MNDHFNIKALDKLEDDHSNLKNSLQARLGWYQVGIDLLQFVKLHNDLACCVKNVISDLVRENITIIQKLYKHLAFCGKNALTNSIRNTLDWNRAHL